MFGPPRISGVDSEFVFPDWSPHEDLGEAVRAYFRDPELALEALNCGLAGQAPAGFSLERVVFDDGRVWQEAVVCDGERILLWHGEDIIDDQFGASSFSSALRTIPLSRVTETGYRRIVGPPSDEESANGERELRGVDVYILLESIDEATQLERDGEPLAIVSHDAIRMAKMIDRGGAGQMQRLLAFAQLLSSLVPTQ